MLEQAARGLTLCVVGSEPELVVPTVDVPLDDSPLRKPFDCPTDDQRSVLTVTGTCDGEPLEFVFPLVRSLAVPLFHPLVPAVGVRSVVAIVVPVQMVVADPARS